MSIKLLQMIANIHKIQNIKSSVLIKCTVSCERIEIFRWIQSKCKCIENGIRKEKGAQSDHKRHDHTPGHIEIAHILFWMRSSLSVCTDWAGLSMCSISEKYARNVIDCCDGNRHERAVKSAIYLPISDEKSLETPIDFRAVP